MMVKYLVVTVSSFIGQTFEKVETVHCRIVNVGTNSELARFRLSERGDHSGIVMASLIRENEGWIFKALGTLSESGAGDHLMAQAVQALS